MNVCIDTHQHLWDPALFSYSWMQGLPSLHVRHGIAEYREATRGMDVVGTVYVDTDVDEMDLAREAAWIFNLADDPANRILGIVASARLEKENCFDHLEPFRGHAKLKGVRRVLHTQDDAIFGDGQFLRNLASLEECGWSFDLCVQARQLPLAAELVRRFPGILFILDHGGSPAVKAQELEPWRTQVRALAAETNVVCKLSGFVAYADPAACTERELGPFVEEVIGGFGWDRLLWGSDWPVCTLTCPLQRWMDLAESLVRRATPEQRNALFIENAKRVYRLQLPEGNVSIL